MIICGYPLVGKTTIAKESDKIIDLDCRFFDLSSEFNVISYCTYAKELSDQGYTVLISSHKSVRECLADMCYHFSLWYPAPNLKSKWIKMAWDRYNKTQMLKDKRIARRIERFFDEDIKSLESEHHLTPPIVIEYPICDNWISYHNWLSGRIKALKPKVGTDTLVVPVDENKTPIMTICGSMKFKDICIHLAANYAIDGYMVFTPSIFDVKFPNSLNNREHQALDEVHRAKIDISDVVYIVNVDGYIGEDTRKEIEYAKSKGKCIEYYEDPVPDCECDFDLDVDV